MVEEQVKVPVQDAYGQIYYKTKYVQKEKPGGWDKCKGPFDESLAVKYGIDVWDCDSNCFTRTDKSGSKSRREGKEWPTFYTFTASCHDTNFIVTARTGGCHDNDIPCAAIDDKVNIMAHSLSFNVKTVPSALVTTGS